MIYCCPGLNSHISSLLSEKNDIKLVYVVTLTGKLFRAHNKNAGAGAKKPAISID